LPPEDRFGGMKIYEDIRKWCALVSDLEEILYHLDTSGHPKGPFGKLTSNLHEPCIDRSLSVLLGHAGACLGYSYWTPNLKTVVIYRKHQKALKPCHSQWICQSSTKPVCSDREFCGWNWIPNWRAP
jgi:hypothetical protein